VNNVWVIKLPSFLGFKLLQILMQGIEMLTLSGKNDSSIWV